MPEKSLGDALPEEISRVQELIKILKSLPNGHGKFSAELMQRDVGAAQKAMIEGDLAGMVTAYKALKEWAD
jgi:hypothetical protein